MATRRYGETATTIFKKIMQIKDPKEQKDFAFQIFNKFVFLEDIEFLLRNIEK